MLFKLLKKGKAVNLNESKRGLLKGMVLTASGLLLPGYSMAGLLKGSKKRKIALYNTHTREDIEVTYWKNGSYQERELSRINELLRDHRREEVMAMDVDVIDQIFAIQKRLGSKEQVSIISGYRSKSSNEELRQRRRGVAKRSYHTLGRAIDIRIPGQSLSKQRKAALQLSAGGVGYYRRSNFLHIDTGPVRRW